MSQDPKATKPTRWGRWWKVEFIQAAGEIKTEVFEFAHQAEKRYDQLKAEGVRCRIRRCRFDIYVVDHDAQLIVLVNRRMLHRDAIRWASDWTKLNDVCGVLIVHSGKNAPAGYAVTDFDGNEVLA